MTPFPVEMPCYAMQYPPNTSHSLLRPKSIPRNSELIRHDITQIH